MIPDRWLVLAVRPEEAGAAVDLSPDEVGGRVADALVSIGGRAVEERDGAWITHLPPPPDLDRLLGELPGRLLERTGVRWSVEHRWQPHEAWTDLWRRGLTVRRIGRRIVVRPSWCPAPDTGPDDVVLELDPGIAFGTAEHGTTRGCLRLLEAAVREGDRIVDVGAGSGILSLAAAGLGADSVLGLDSDPVAVEAARENVARNAAGDRIRVEVREVTPSGIEEDGPFDGAAANLETPLLLPLLPALVSAVRPGGWLVLGGIQEEEEARVRTALDASGAEAEAVDADEGWWSVLARRAGPG